MSKNTIILSNQAEQAVLILCDRVWSAIGSDLMGCCEEEEASISNEEACESILDADRVEMYGYTHSTTNDTATLKKSWEEFVAYPWSARVRWLMLKRQYL